VVGGQRKSEPAETGTEQNTDEHVKKMGYQYPLNKGMEANWLHEA
jgi:hypothetical protein